MTETNYTFYLKVQRVEKTCLFELSWGEGQQLTVTLPYPENLTIFYQEWSSVYLSFYKQALRGRVAQTGSLGVPPIDWHAKLVQAEATLLYEFHQWLRSAQLFEIRSRIAQVGREWGMGNGEWGEGGRGERGERGRGDDSSPLQKNHSLLPTLDIFLTCNPLEIARLPWEAWEIGREFAARGSIRIVRMPVNIQGKTVTPQNRGHRARILAILGDDTGLDFKADKDAVRSLSPIADIEFIGWQPGQDINTLKTRIINTIAEENGWDILFFAGHSNETILTGGEFAIAPGTSLLLRELEEAITIAKERGLQFAIFNSCNGLSIANGLIDLGLSQVAVMREPIHNKVAQEFLLRFLQSLAEYKDVHESLLLACQYLKLEKHLTYPSAYLIPSLFRHPNAELFRIKPFGNKERLKRWLPTKKEAIALAILISASWQLPIQDILLEQRVLIQARYRQFTNQVPMTKEAPVLLVQIDEDSIKKAGISDPKPMNRRYLAQLVDKLTALDAKVVGIDYLLDRYQKENDQYLADAIQTSIQKNQTWFVFGTKRKDGGGWFNLLPDFTNQNWSLQGDVMLLFANRISHVTLVPRRSTDPRTLPFAYLLSLGYWSNFEGSSEAPQPQLQSSVNWLSQVKKYVNEQTDKDYKQIFSQTAQLQTITNFSYQYNQRWLHPIIDFSIPPNQVYKRLPAWQLLDTPVDALKLDLKQNREWGMGHGGWGKKKNQQQEIIKKQPIVIIAAGGYGEAGVAQEGEDNFPVPAGLKYWRFQENPPDLRQVFPGSEVHAYLIHHFLTQRLVLPIPDLWLLGLAALLGKWTVLSLDAGTKEGKEKTNKLLFFFVPSGRSKWMIVMAGATGIYGLVSLQLYVTGGVLLPLIIPAIAFWSYVMVNLAE